MTPETTLATKLKKLKDLMLEKEGLDHKYQKKLKEIQEKSEQEQEHIANRYNSKIDEFEANSPVAPLKKQLKSTTPSITVAGICAPLALLLSIVMIIISISTFVKIGKINSVVEQPGEAYEEWCEVLTTKGDFDDMTEEEWESVQKEWNKNGVSITWKDVQEINAKNEFNIYSGRIVYEIFEEKLDSLPMTGGFCVFIAIVGIILLIVFKKGFADILITLEEIWNIPKIKRQNTINYLYNKNEYPKLLKLYEEDVQTHTEKINLAKEERDSACQEVRIQAKKEQDNCIADREHEKNKYNEKIDALRSEVGLDGCSISTLDMYDLIQSVEAGDATSAIDAYRLLQQKKHRLEMDSRERERQERFERTMAPSHIKAINYSSQVDDDYEREVRRHNMEMERMERERMQMEKDIARKEERERQKAKEREEHEIKRQEFMDHQKAREEKRRNDAGLRHQCNTCQLASKCYGRGSYPCPTYRPR